MDRFLSLFAALRNSTAASPSFRSVFPPRPSRRGLCRYTRRAQRIISASGPARSSSQETFSAIYRSRQLYSLRPDATSVSSPWTMTRAFCSASAKASGDAGRLVARSCRRQAVVERMGVHEIRLPGTESGHSPRGERGLLRVGKTQQHVARDRWRSWRTRHTFGGFGILSTTGAARPPAVNPLSQ